MTTNVDLAFATSASAQVDEMAFSFGLPIVFHLTAGALQVLSLFMQKYYPVEYLAYMA
jgi:hypothetical protein